MLTSFLPLLGGLMRKKGMSDLGSSFETGFFIESVDPVLQIDLNDSFTN